MAVSLASSSNSSCVSRRSSCSGRVLGASYILQHIIYIIYNIYNILHKICIYIYI
jgi:hypothetical protein